MKNVNLPGKLFASCCNIVLFLMLSLSFPASAQQKVVGGVDVDIKDYPWQVALTSSPSGSGFCGGSIIGDSWVLTAAHCVNGDSPSGLYIRVGSSDPFASGGDSYSVNQIIVHPNYSGNSYDFALVEIEGAFDYNENVASIDLVTPADIADGVQDGGVMATITGWGTTSSGGSLSSTLQMVEAPIVENNVACGSSTDSNGNSGDYSCSSLDETMICAGDLIDGGEDACQGDSGGPLAVRNAANTKWLLIGATSWGYGCADVNYPGVWSKVSYVLDWITSNADVTSQICADETACNYTYDATGEAEVNNALCIYEIDECGDCGGDGPTPGYDCDGNCTTGETLVVTMSDSYGDGWNGNNIVINGVSSTLSSGSGATETLCYDSTDGCVTVVCGGGSWETEVSWTIADADGNVLLTGGAPYDGGFGDCNFPVPGCIDSLASNYNPNANEDDGSCIYPLNCDGLTYVTINVTEGSYASEVSWSIEGTNFVGVTGSSEACLEDGCFVFNMSDSYGDGWNGSVATITTDDGYELLNGTLESGSEGMLSFALSYDGDCGPIYGCMDSLALNFDPLATSGDNSCLYPEVGCMDSLALNYNPAATEDDGSCTYPLNCDGLTYVNIEVGGGSWASEVSWELNGLQGQTGSVEACLEDDCYIFNMYDSYGDGWNGNTVTISDGEDILLTGTLEDGSEGVLSFALNYDGECGPAYGCTDSLALNFNSEATSDDGSCEYPLLGCTDALALNYNQLATEDDGSCTYPLDCEGLTTIMIEVGGGTYDYEISWELNGLEGTVGSTEYCLDSGCYTFNMYDSYGDGWNGATVSITTATGESLISGTLEAGTSGTLLFSYNEDCGYVSGCMDPAATNYNSEAILDDGSCEYPVFGCTDESAINYNADATDDDGSCYYDSDVLGCMDATADNYNADATFDDGSCEYPFSCDEGYVADCNGNCAPASWIGDNLCDDGSYSSGGVSIYLNCDQFDNDGGDCENVVIDSLGCTDPSASNYNPNAFVDDGSCVYDVESGCTDMEALNYNPNAIEDDGSCEYPIDCEGLTTVIIDMSDSYGDGWNGNVLTINGQSFTFESGYEASATACYNSDNGDCAYVSCDGGSWQSEVSWTISDIDGNVLLSGGAPFEGAFGGDDCGPIYGCTDPSALNYNELATADDGSCDYDIIIDYGACTDPDAINYDPNATFDDGSCEYETECLDFSAELTVNTVSFGTEHTWAITDANGTELYSGGQYANNLVTTVELCLDADASYVMTIEDTYGDGWNGGTFSIATSNCELVAGGLEEGQEAMFDFTASCDGGNTGGDAPWEFLITGSNHTIVIDGDAIIDLNEMPIEIGDALGVFFTDDNGDLQCGGFASWTGNTNSIAAQGDDTTTDEVDGFTSGSSFIWMIWDASEDMVYAANAEYSASMPNQGEYTTNGISALASLATMPAVSEQLISMPAGWSIFSTYMTAEDMDMAAVLAPIYSDLVIAKNNAGQAYLPEWEFNGVGDLEIGQAYQIKLTNENELIIGGTYMSPEENSIALTAGWNMIGYLRLESADAAAVLSAINATGNLVIAKDYNGQAYLPEWDFNGIGDMKPGEGYQLKINNDDVLLYNANDVSYRTSSTEVTLNNVEQFGKVTLTDNNMTVVIEDAAWDILPADGAEVAAFDKAGTLIGSALYSSPVTVLTVWGDDVTSTAKDGLVDSETVSFKVWSDNTTETFEVSNWLKGSSAYTADAINVASTIITANTSSATITSERVLLKVINVLGQEVTTPEAFKGEILFNVYNDGTVEKMLK